jgi:hypothetical protein
MTRQYHWQQKMLAAGRCILCGKRAVTKRHCRVHRHAHNQTQLAHYYRHRAQRLAYMKKYNENHRKRAKARTP